MNNTEPYEIVRIKQHSQVVRGSYGTFTLKVKNTSSDKWCDYGKRGSANGCMVVGLITKNDWNKKFRILAGDKESKNDYRFTGVKSPDSMRYKKTSCAGPGSIIKFTFRINAKDTANSGSHSIRLTLGNPGTAKSLTDKGRYIEINFKVKKKKKSLYASIKKLYRDILIKYYSVEVYSNSSYARLDKKALIDFQPVVMALWKRIDRLERVVSQIEVQKDAAPILYLWLNDSAEQERVRKIIKNSELPIVLYVCSKNIGGFGRFYLARELASKYAFCLFIDDDQELKEDTVATFFKEAEPRMVKSQWSFKLQSPINYWDRIKCKDGGNADYCGTGGMIIDTAIFNEPGLFRCPRRFWFAEDIWLSFFAKQNMGYGLKATYSTLVILKDNLDQSAYLVDTKNEMLSYLLRKGWSIRF